MRQLQTKFGTQIPQIGYGTYKLAGELCRQNVTEAIKIGYRMIDTAQRYENHKEVGQGIKDSGINRNELFVTTKIWRDFLHKDDLINACKQSLSELQLDYVDLLLIHYPNKDIPIEESIEALNMLVDQKLIREYGVSNFTVHHLEDAFVTPHKISVNQIEVHPSLYQQGLIEFCQNNNILVTAYSPLAQGEDLGLSEVIEVASRHNISRAQTILAWLMAKGLIVIPKGSNKEQMEDNFKSVDIQLERDDLDLLDHVKGHFRLINPPFAEFDY